MPCFVPYPPTIPAVAHGCASARALLSFNPSDCACSHSRSCCSCRWLFFSTASVFTSLLRSPLLRLDSTTTTSFIAKSCGRLWAFCCFCLRCSLRPALCAFAVIPPRRPPHLFPTSPNLPSIRGDGSPSRWCPWWCASPSFGLGSGCLSLSSTLMAVSSNKHGNKANPTPHNAKPYTPFLQPLRCLPWFRCLA